MKHRAPAILIAFLGLGLCAQEGPKVIPITAKRFEFSPREVHLKKGEKVTLVLKSGDVTHGLFCRGLKLDEDIDPGRETRVEVTPGQEGQFVAICNHFCGGGHAGMKMTFVVD